MNYKAAMVGSNSASSDATSGGRTIEEHSQPSQIASMTESPLQITIHKLNGKTI
jgi:hypothetical protein